MKGLKDLRLLIVDDEEEIREVLQQYLRRKVKSVQIAQSGTEALDLMTRDDFDVVITDIMMPGAGADGVSLTRKIRSSFPKTQVIIAITGRSNETEQELLNAGINKVLYKPFQLSTLMSSIEGCFRMSSPTP